MIQNESGISMPILILMIILLGANLSQVEASETQEDMDMLVSEANQIAQKFSKRLKPQLKNAMKNGGAVHAINVCATQAPQIAEQLSLETGWKVKRVSLKPRNTPNAQADEFETKVLEDFDERQKKGESAATISFSGLHEGQYRFMKAQGVAPICLNCHGKVLAKEVLQTLNKHYAKDLAKGYALGEIRGAISLSKILQ